MNIAIGTMPFRQYETCNQLGHSDDQCVVYKCDKCGRFGHTTMDCRFLLSTQYEKLGHSDVTAYVISEEYVIPSPIVELISRLEARIAALEVVVFSHSGS